MIKVAVSPSRFPAEANADLEIRLTNDGQGMCTNIIFTIRLPAGIMRVSGKDRLEVSKLAPGESITSHLRVLASREGPHQLTSPNFSYRDHQGQAHREDGVIAKIIVEPKQPPRPVAADPGISADRPVESRLRRVFLCYSSSDKSRVRALRRRLLDDEIQPWFDEEDILPGQDFDFAICKAIRASSAVLVCLSEESVSKVGYVQKEIKHVLDAADEQPEGTIFVIPVRLEPCDVPERLHRWQWVDLFKEDGYPRLLRALRSRNSD